MDERDRPLPPGKLPPELLRELLERYVDDDPSVLIGPGVGRDAAAVAVGDRAIVVKTDPITFATADVGRYLVNVNANDIACMGGRPRWLLVTALFPERSTTPRLAEEIFAGLALAARELGIALVGGHSEITIGLDRPILVGQMIGEADPSALLDARNARPGDAILLCRGIAIEGTAILAREAADRLTAAPPDLLASAGRFLVEPGISVVPAARSLLEAGVAVRGLHDPTEGGLVTALGELSAASGLGIEINSESVPIYPETRAICEALGLDPLGLIASGALLAIVSASDAARAVDAARRAGVPAQRIGAMLEAGAGCWLSAAGSRSPLPVFEVDEIARYFASG